MNSLVLKLRNFLNENNADALLINSTNEFLVEYNQLKYNARYAVTGFSGSTGDALLTKDKLYLFVDGRYHEQADNEADKTVVDVIKLEMGQSYLKTLVEKIGFESNLIVVSTKNSLSFSTMLEDEIKKNNSKITYISFDPVFEDNVKSHKMIECDDIVIVPTEITENSCDEKISLITGSLLKDDILVVTALEDVAYFTNRRSFCIPYSSTYPAKLIIQKDKAILFTDSNIGYIGEKFRTKKLSDFDFHLANIKEKNIYIDKKSISAQDYMLIDASNKILESKAAEYKTIKNQSEINHFKYAFSNADNALNIIDEMINSDKIYSEHEYCEALKKSFVNNNALGLSFSPIVASGANSSIIHYSIPSNNKLVQDGDFLLVDCGAYYEGGYATDITRTFIKGEPSAEQKKVYTTVLKAFFNAYKKEYSKSSTWFDIDNIARTIINENKQECFSFNHSTGHGVGISVHESPPYIGPSDLSKAPITKHSVFTIEPGLYKENWGGVRLENTVYIKDINDKIEIESLSRYKFENKLIDYNMLSDNEKKWINEWQEL